MVRKLHRKLGILIVFWFFLLTITGILLNHEKNTYDFPFLWKIELPLFFFSDYALKINGNRDITSLHKTAKGTFVGSMTGLYHLESGRKLYNGRVFKIEPLRTKLGERDNYLFLATDKSLKLLSGNQIKSVALKDKIITSVAVFYPFAFAVEKKKKIYAVNLLNGLVTELKTPSAVELPKSIRLGRFVRDFHYGRALFENPLSAYLNDLFSLTLLWSIVTGLVLLLVRRTRGNRKKKRLFYKLHGTLFLSLFLPFVFLLVLTGLFINRWDLYRGLMDKEVSFFLVLPPYREPISDIWDIDYDGKSLRVATRLGLYRLNRDRWVLECEGFAYKLRRFGKKLFISGMGAPNRLLKDGKCTILKGTPSMPIDFVKDKKGVIAIKREGVKLERSSLPLYIFLLSLHDTSLLGSHLLILNDITALLGLFLMLSALYFWWKRVKIKSCNI